MPLSIGIPLGITIILTGVILFFAINKRRLALMMIGLGAVIALLTFALIILAVNSSM